MVTDWASDDAFDIGWAGVDELVTDWTGDDALVVGWVIVILEFCVLFGIGRTYVVFITD